MPNNEDVIAFYDTAAADYHLIFRDWLQAQEEQGRLLDRLIRTYIDAAQFPLSVLDCTCGIGTQAIGLAKQDGYLIHASDISPQALARAKREAEQAGVRITFEVADMRTLSKTITEQFDVVIAFDNAIPHLLTDEDLSLAVQELRAKTRAGGLFLASIRDYDALLEERPQLVSPRLIATESGMRVLFQVWEWQQEEQYRLTQFIVLPQGSQWQMRSCTTTYRALRRETLTSALSQAGFAEIRWLMPAESGFYQPIVVATANA